MTLRKSFSKVAEIEISYKGNRKQVEKSVIKTSKDAYHIFLETWDSNKLELQEHFRVMLLDRDNSVLGVSTIATGGMAACLVDVKLLFATAILAKSAGLIIAHNHPSGKKEFSTPDMELTEKIVMAGKVLDLPLLDHILVTHDGYVSMADIGNLPSRNLSYRHDVVPF